MNKHLLADIRAAMDKHGIDTYLITKSDPHMSENASDYWNGISFVSGFTGSSARVLITKDFAGLWTDGRYFIQAASQIADSGLTLMKDGEKDVPDFYDYARDNTPENGCIGFDGRSISAAKVKDLRKLVSIKDISIKPDIDILSALWPDRPNDEVCEAIDHPLELCGVSRFDKLASVRKSMQEKNAQVYVLSTLDDIAYLFNLRRKAPTMYTYFTAYAVICPDEAVLFTDCQIADTLLNTLKDDGVTVMHYDEVFSYIKGLATKNSALPRVIYSPESTCELLASIIQDFPKEKLTVNLTTTMKAKKNATEIACMEKANLHDGASMVRIIKWIEDEIANRKASGQPLTEWDIALKIQEIRGMNPDYLCPSFTSIVAYMDNAAMAHYSPSPEQCKAVTDEGFLLIDSGGQYTFGTTDTTRTLILGEISPEMRRDFSLVLKSHISLAQAVFIYGASGANLDTFARMPLWEHLKDFNHGTGHGLGFCLNVHEGPQGIGMKSKDIKFEEGMITTNEPGIYIEGAYGIRTENTVLCEGYMKSEFGQFMHFKTISLCPIDPRGIDTDILNEKDLVWLNAYNKEVLTLLSPLLSDEEVSWLKGYIKTEQ